MSSLGPYTGYVVGGALLALVLVFNQWVFRRRWSTYPSREQYLAAHPGCDRASGVVCHQCGAKALGMGVAGRGRIYRCAGCEDELFRVDQAD